ncbi:MAG: Hpt domain-containing protein [Cyanobacteriota bacterium]|nr:Hpt domain-containing protein [Cyanobacteriota bacterium]
MSSEQEERIKRLFLLEAEEHLQTLENLLVDLKATMEDSESVNEMYRAAHSVKGGAAMLGFTSVNKIAHRLEDCFKIIKDNPVDIDDNIESQFVKGYDVLKELVEKIQDPYGLRDEEGEGIVKAALPFFEDLENNLNSLIAGGKPAKGGGSKPKIPANFATKVKGELKPILQLFKQGESPATRKQLVAASDRLLKLGAGIEKWESLIETAKRAVANSKNSYKVLAPVIIKEINQAGEVVQAGKAPSLTPSKDLQKLAGAAAKKTAPAAASPAAKPAAAGKPTMPKEPKDAVRLLIKTYNKKELQAIAKYLVNHVKKLSK